MAESNYENARWKDLNLDLILTLKRKPGVPLYAVLAKAVKQSMLEHELNSGDPLPSARELAKQYHLSTSTALRAYEVLSSQGYVETSPKSATPQAYQGHSLYARSDSGDSGGETRFSVPNVSRCR
jgi:DNA-binding transcriptional regulator YhcF (GntR family)